MDERPRYMDVISRDLTTCDCGAKIIVYVFNDGTYRTTHKHNGVEHVPTNYLPVPNEEDVK